MPPESENAKAGLGTSIVTAVAAQLDAMIIVRSAEPGTIVLIDHVAPNELAFSASEPALVPV
jgi:two-component sensor histidine kinase